MIPKEKNMFGLNNTVHLAEKVGGKGEDVM